MTKFYHFDQNNSGGKWDYDEKSGIGMNVIVEAYDHDHANILAECIGLYFNGCMSCIDCPCCGDRWYVQCEYDGDTVPSIYGESIEDGVYRNEYVSGWGHKYYGFIHYLDGSIVPFTLGD